MDGHHPDPVPVEVRTAGEHEAREAHGLHGPAGRTDVACFLGPAEDHVEPGQVWIGQGCASGLQARAGCPLRTGLLAGWDGEDYSSRGMDERQERDLPAAPPTQAMVTDAGGLCLPGLEGRRALVVGGSGGIGAACSAALAGRGAELLVHGGNSAERLGKAVEAARAAAALRSRATGRQAAGVEGFLLGLGPEGAGPLVDRLPSLGRIDILVCAFGPFVRKPLHETGVSDWERLALLDLALPGALASALVGAMAARGWGRFLFFGGTRTDVIRAYASNAAYAAAKTGLGVLVKSLAAEYSGQGIGAFLLCPGFVDTEYLSPAAREGLVALAPRGSLLEARGLADFGVGLICSDPPLASGSVINLDGGLRL